MKVCRRKIYKRFFLCPVCGAEVPATATKRMTVPGHVKTMWCFRCRETRNFIQKE